jgi:hypothetical protein
MIIMPKKITVIGRGTVGAVSTAFFLKNTDWNIDWIFDPSIPTTSVGEGTNLVFPAVLKELFGFKGVDLINLEGNVKTGIEKKNWGKGNTFFHSFDIDKVGVHFNAIKLQDKISEILKNEPRVTIIEAKIENPNELDSDYVLVCSGPPISVEKDNFIIKKYIPVNSSYIVQCDWARPEFSYTLTIARKYGWVFGIPLQNRCSIGYLFNKDITPNIDDIKEDIKSVIKEYNLTPSSRDPKTINFSNYMRKENFNKKVVYNGNSSFFLEPLEATSTSFSTFINTLALQLWNNEITEEYAQSEYEKRINDLEGMIDLHYMAGSIFDNEFWKYAKRLATEKIELEYINKTRFSKFVSYAVTSNEKFFDPNVLFVGSWPVYSYKFNINNLGIENQIIDLTKKYLL